MQLRNKKQSTSRWVPGKTALRLKWEDHSASRALKGIEMADVIAHDHGAGAVNFYTLGFFIKEDKGMLILTDSIEEHESPGVGMIRSIISHDILELKVL